MFDLFHELYHVIYDNDQIIHNSDFRTMIKEGMPEDENMANKFANAFLLGPNYQDLVNTCLKHANYDLALLKSSVQTIANRKSLPVDILANLVAYNLSLQNKDWWGAAENLQTKDPIYKPQSIVNNVLLQRININLLSKPDLDILTPIIT